jgi:hypothetical protein
MPLAGMIYDSPRTIGARCIQMALSGTHGTEAQGTPYETGKQRHTVHNFLSTAHDFSKLMYLYSGVRWIGRTVSVTLQRVTKGVGE